jgi:hypothetical protein
MPSAIYQLFRHAILHHQQITCDYDGCHREICPHVLGHTDGQEKALTYQFAGQSTSGLPPGGEWRCLSLKRVRNPTLRDGVWHTGRQHITTQTCVRIVDLDVNR